MSIISTADGLGRAVDAAFEDVVALRRRLHKHPELGLDLPLTQAAVLEALDGLPLEIRLGRSASSVVAVLEGAAPGPAIILRGDMDALPLTEDNALEYASEVPGCMHACGHDAHTAMLAGAMRVLAGLRDQFAGRVIGMFQPGEEGQGGALRMIEEGLLDGPDGERDQSITGAFAIHITPSLSTGWVAARPGTMLASTDEFRIFVEGRGGHGSMPHQALDPVPVACEVVLALQSAVTRRIDAFDPAVITVGHLQAGTTTNVIPPRVELEGTIRATSPGARALARQLVQRVTEGVAAAHGAGAKVELIEGYSVTANHPEFVELVDGVARKLVGDDRTAIPMPSPVMGAEDFGEVLARVPGAMVFLGACPPELDPAKAPPNHSNLMRIDEAAMRTGVALHASVALAHLGRSGTG